MFDTPTFKSHLHTANMKSVSAMTSRVLSRHSKQCLHLIHSLRRLSTGSPGTASVPKMQISIFIGGGEAEEGCGGCGGGTPLCSVGHAQGLTLLGRMDAASSVA